MNLRLEKAGKNFVVRLISDHNSSFGIKREFHVDLKEYPFLNWRWKAVRLPRGGDVRNAAKDDQAVQLYVAFPATGFPAELNTPVIGYIWDNEAPRGWTGTERPDRRQESSGTWWSATRPTSSGSGTPKAGTSMKTSGIFSGISKGWIPSRYGIQFHINSQYTKSEAEGCIGDVFFSRNAVRSMTASVPFPPYDKPLDITVRDLTPS